MARTAVILSYSLWRTTFHADPRLIGQAIDLKGEPYTVVGVLPAGARTPLNADLYIALRPSPQGEGGSTNYGLILRLRDGANWRQADVEINRAWARPARRFADQFHPGSKISFYTVPLQKAQTTDLRPKALTLMVAAGFILLIACANLAGLTVVRMARRTSEIATRMALGASRWNIQRQLWIENLLLASIGGTVGVGVGFLALRGLLSLLPRDYLPVAGVPLDERVLAFSLAASILTSVLFGMLPTLALRRIDLRSFMATRTIAGLERLGLRQALIVSEVALTVVLLVASGLLIRSLIHLQSLPPGFNPQGVMTAKASLDDARYRDPAAFDRLLNQSTSAMERIPGVQSAAVGLSLPYERALNNGITLGSGPQMGQQVMSGELYVTPSYFATLEIPLLAGRSFTGSDRRGTQPVAIVNRSFVRKYFLGVNPVGQALDKQGTIIVGVAEDVALPPHHRADKRSAWQRTDHVHPGNAGRPPLDCRGQRLVSTKLDCPHFWSHSGSSRPDAAGFVQRRSGPALFRFLHHDRSSCGVPCNTKSRGGSSRRHGSPRAAFERRGHLCIGCEYGGATNTGNRPPHRAWIHNPPGDGTRRRTGNQVFGNRNCSRPVALSRSAAGDAQRAIRCEYL